MSDVIRIAMWSGPRNISTAMMRSWGSRADTVVCDEPLYAWYLRETGLDHPARDEVLASQPNDWRDVVATLTGAVPGGAAIYYQKHMAHHLVGDIELDWLDQLTHVFLLREPRAMLVSLAKVLPRVTLPDTGLPQQLRLYRALTAAGGAPPPVLDARQVLEDPAAALRALCMSVGVPYDSAMLSWPSGGRATDGVWAPHWYAAVNRSTSFAPYRPLSEELPAALRPLLAECDDMYAELSRFSLES